MMIMKMFATIDTAREQNDPILIKQLLKRYKEDTARMRREKMLFRLKMIYFVALHLFTIYLLLK